MLAYRHGFHAGNHADIFKHIVLSLVLEYEKKKETPFLYFDSHSGGGLYDLNSDFAQKTEEAKTGCDLLSSLDINNIPKTCKSYFSLVKDTMRLSACYPGSPMIAMQSLREQDSMIFVELHPTEFEILKEIVNKDSRVHLHHRDGFEALCSLLPPKTNKNACCDLPRRGVALIDPSYELAEDYNKAFLSVTKSAKKWNTGLYILWYPLLAHRMSEIFSLKQGLKDFCVDNKYEFLNTEFSIRNPGREITQEHISSLYGSGIFVIRPTWQLDEQLNTALEVIKPLWANASFLIKQNELI